MNATSTQAKTQPRTVGDAINEKVEEYKKIYHSLKNDSNPTIRGKARTLALHDLLMGRFIAEQALQEVEAYIKTQEGATA